MNYNFFIVGGDLRILHLSKLLKKEGHNVKVLGFDKILQLDKNLYKEIQDLKIGVANSINEASETDVVISSIPLSIDGENIYAPHSNKEIPLNALKRKKFIAGKITNDIINKIYENEKVNILNEQVDQINIKTEKENITLYDILKDEPNIILNTLPTAEGAIARAIEDTTFNITNANVLVLGFGNVGKTLCKKLKDAGANVYAEARKQKDLAWIEVYGYTPIHLENLKENVCKMDIVFNTVPYMILDKSTLILMSKETLIIDLASKPGGVDFETAKKLGIKAYLYSGIPGKIAPKTSAEYIVKYVKEKLVE